jgi:hypothetical protein
LILPEFDFYFMVGRVITCGLAVLKIPLLSLAKNNTIKVGGDLKVGTYTAEVIQGLNRQIIKLVKLK